MSVKLVPQNYSSITEFELRKNWVKTCFAENKSYRKKIL